MNPTVCKDDPRTLQKYFSTQYHIKLKQDWMDCALRFVARSKKSKSLNAAIFDQWLYSDIADSTLPCLSGDFSKCILKGAFLLQTQSATDIASPQLNKKKCELFENVEFPSQEGENEPSTTTKKRCLLFVLSDGNTELKAIEYRMIAGLPPSIPRGCKMLVYGTIPCRRGHLLLTSKNCQLLGGDSPQISVTSNEPLANAVDETETSNQGLKRVQAPCSTGDGGKLSESKQIANLPSRNDVEGFGPNNRRNMESLKRQHLGGDAPQTLKRSNEPLVYIVDEMETSHKNLKRVEASNSAANANSTKLSGSTQIASLSSRNDLDAFGSTNRRNMESLKMNMQHLGGVAPQSSERSNEPLPVTGDEIELSHNMNTTVCKDDPRTLQKYFSTQYHLKLKQNWLDCAVRFVARSKKSKSLNAAIFDQWLYSDIADSTLPCLSGDFSKCILKGAFLLQTQSATDIASPQLNKKKCELFENVEFPSQEGENEPSTTTKKRCLLFVLSDGNTELKAIEYRMIAGLPPSIPRGCKMLVYGTIPCRRGHLLLTSKNCQLLGGDSPQTSETSNEPLANAVE
ncbi:recQ mediated genome instability protein [Ditylenchus destructor]|nr:recQ mediated genome instability protein [Ditylenchus destructor]